MICLRIQQLIQLLLSLIFSARIPFQGSLTTIATIIMVVILPVHLMSVLVHHQVNATLVILLILICIHRL